MATYTGADKAVGYLFTASNNTAAEYSAAATYAVGAFVIHEGTLYKCTSAISTPEDWTPAHWTQTTIMENAGGGGGGGTTVIANPAGSATDTLNKLQVGSTIYDVPSGGGSGHNYSTSEQVVGAWVDGSTLFEKTLVYSVSDFHDQTIDTSVMRGNFYIDLSNISAIWIDYGASFLKNTYSGLNPKSLALNYAAGGSAYTRTNIQQSAVNSGKPFIYFENTWAPSVFYDARNNLTWYITIKYTKSV